MAGRPPETVLRSSRAEDLPALLDLFERSFGRRLDAEAWRWKYDSLPGGSRSLVATKGGELLAHVGALGLPARWRGGEGLAWQLVDFMGSTRTLGLRSAMVPLGQKLLASIPESGDAPWIFGFPGERHYRLGERVFGYRPIGRIPVLAGPLAEASAGAAGTLADLGISDSCGEWVETTWEACDRLGVRRSAAFLNWRYHARPDRYYRFYRLAQPEPIVDGLAVFGFHERRAVAAELWLPAGGSWRRPLAAVAEDLRSMGANEWSFWPPHDPGHAALLEDLGVGPTSRSLFAGYCLGAGGCASEAEGFYYAMGDYDST